jgi:transposase InsO family protein
VLTDNAKAYHARAWLERAHELGIACRYTRIYRPRTNGKAERFIQTLLTEWAYASSYPSSVARTARSQRGRPSAASHTCVVRTASYWP